MTAHPLDLAPPDLGPLRAVAAPRRTEVNCNKNCNKNCNYGLLKPQVMAWQGAGQDG